MRVCVRILYIYIISYGLAVCQIFMIRSAFRGDLNFLFCEDLFPGPANSIDIILSISQNPTGVSINLYRYNCIDIIVSVAFVS